MSLRRQGKDAARRGVHLCAGGPLLIACLVLGVPWARVHRALRRRRGVGPRILWAPVPIVNCAYTARADRLQGFDSTSLVYGVYRINARTDFDIVLDRPAGVPLLRDALPYAVLLWALVRIDILGLFFDGGLLYATPAWRLELPLLRLAGVRTIVYPYGDDARLPSVLRARGGWHLLADTPPGGQAREERETCRRVAAIARHADVVLGCGDLHEELPRVDGILRYPLDTAGWEPAPPEADDGVVTIVHAPNHPQLKGTRHLQAAVAALRAEGLPVELDLVQGLPNAEARERYRRADIVVDQLLAGAYALFAVECMALGKPVVCRLDDRHRAVHPEWVEAPIVHADPDTVTDVLRRLVLDPELRRTLGARGPAYVERHHSLASVGADLAAIHRRLWA